MRGTAPVLWLPPSRGFFHKNKIQVGNPGFYGDLFRSAWNKDGDFRKAPFFDQESRCAEALR